jgi:hypothetical protein
MRAVIAAYTSFVLKIVHTLAAANHRWLALLNANELRGHLPLVLVSVHGYTQLNSVHDQVWDVL